MNWKRTTAMISAAAMLLCAYGVVPGTAGDMSLTASAYTYGTYNGMSYMMSDAHVDIIDFDNSLTSVTIPSKIEGLPVISIGSSAFENATLLKSVTISDGVTTIGQNAFNNCTSLENVSLPDTITKIDDWAFGYCISLPEITFPESVDELGWGVVQNCVSLQELVIPEGVNVIGEYFASGCTNLRSVHIGNGPAEIQYAAFRDCTSLNKIYIPLSVTNIPSNSGLNNCPISDVYYAGTATQWRAMYGYEYIPSTATIHYGAKEIPPALTPDLNGDGEINAIDASFILQYAAYAGAGGTDDLATFLEGLL